MECQHSSYLEHKHLTCKNRDTCKDIIHKLWQLANIANGFAGTPNPSIGASSAFIENNNLKLKSAQRPVFLVLSSNQQDAMKQLKYIIVLLFIPFLLLCSCKSEQESISIDSQNENIWKSNSRQIYILRFNGLTEDPDDRYSELDYTKESLSEEAVQKLETITTTTNNLECWNDAETYDITITNDSGNDNEYFSNNKACNDVSGKKFVSKSEVNELFLLL